MAKLHFYYSAMNAGKSTILLQSNYNYHERGMDTLLFMPEVDQRFGKNKISSRIGLYSQAQGFDLHLDFYRQIKQAVSENQNIRCVLIDEAQFLMPDQVKQLCQVTVNLDTPVLAYGLRTDFRGEPFPGSQYLLALADQLIEIKTICHCGKKATMNLRIDEHGEAVREGEQIEIGGNDRYIATCYKHFILGQSSSNSSPQQKETIT